MAKDLLDKAKDWAQILSLIAIPVVVAYVGSDIQSSVKERELRRDYVQIATGILGSKDTTPALRSWAVQILEVHSPVRLSQGVRSALISDDAGVADAFRPQRDFTDALSKLFNEPGFSSRDKGTKGPDPMILEPKAATNDKEVDPIIKRPDANIFPLQK
ncbi:hypothetical protein [Achromobacter xylosoxidans]|uniref:hypothetical protein n=1 Tax=Alcaligenes xylosoxydans xylosoxydans TaxID=85698 RepID=UPI001EEC8E8D|nr:hypothetical protein [Achromobacter xylosoxidans]